MATYHISGAGDDLNDGLTKLTAFRTIQHALLVVANDSTIYVHAGNYTGTWGVLPAFNLNIVGMDENKFDAAGAASFMTTPALAKSLNCFGLDFWDWGTGYFLVTTSGLPSYRFFNCVFCKSGAYYQTGPGTGSPSFAQMGATKITLWAMFNCSIFGVQRPEATETPGRYFAANCIFSKCVRNEYYCTARYSALDPYSLAYITDGTGCFSGVATPPPFVSVASGSPDLRFNSAAPNYAAYMANGEFGFPIGALRGLGAAGVDRLAGSLSWIFSQYDKCPNQDMDQSSFFGASWANYERYFRTDFKSVTIAAGVNDKIDFVDDGGVKVATLAVGVYATGADLATEVQTKMAAASIDVITATYLGNTKRLQLSSDGTTFQLPWLTGVNNATTAGADLGFDTSADDTGAVTYTGDNYLVVGDPIATRTAAIWDGTSRFWKMDLDIVPAATSCQVVSPVFDGKMRDKLLYTFGQDEVTGTGAIAYQYRGQDTTFGQQDGVGTTTVDWTATAYGVKLVADNEFQYMEFLASLTI